MAGNTRSRISTDLGGQVALVTGGGRGLGRAIAMDLAAAGAKVACVDLDETTLDETVAAIREAGGVAEGLIGDVTDSARVNAVVEEVVEALGGLTILVNNAGITRDGLLVRMSDQQWESVLAINLTGTFLVTRAAARPMMKARRGRIVNVASVSGLMGNAGQANYSASKAGVIGLTRTVARELAGRGITVNAVAPGFIATDMTAKLGDEVVARIREQVPLGRLGEPQDVSDMVLFLASEAAAYITGQVFPVDGGLTG